MTKQVIAIAGATGFVGRVLIEALLPDYKIVALTRGNLPGTCTIHPGQPCPTLWRKCDLYSLQQCEQALQGVTTAIYLVHSMLPSAKLTQGSFQDMDLLMADNFARAAKKCGVQRILFLSGYVPTTGKLSRHVSSRYEVEKVLGAHGVPVTSLRTGIIIGPGGSSTRMVLRLVRRLPIIPYPPIFKSLTQPIALSDVVDIFRYVIDHPTSGSDAYDIGGPEVLSYRDLAVEAAQMLGLKRKLIPLPWLSLSICKRLLSLCTAAPYKLTAPLVESLRHNMIQSDTRLQTQMGQTPLPLSTAFHFAIHGIPEGSRHRCCIPTPRWKKRFTRQLVRSVQRLPLPPGKTVQWLASEYAKFHHTFFRFLIVGDTSPAGITTIRLRMLRLSLLELSLTPSHSHDERVFFFVTGGHLADKSPHVPGNRPRLEFRQIPGKDFIIVALHDYVPALPWPIYICTQALIHLIFMKLFSRKILSLAKKESGLGATSF
jgi:uncharacterized protein YbjT (DUF2867 family)